MALLEDRTGGSQALGPYKIDFDELTVLLFTLSAYTTKWSEQLIEAYGPMSELIGMDSFQGEAAKSIKGYLEEVHGLAMGALIEIFTELLNKYLLYKDGYFTGIDASLHARLDEQVLDEIFDCMARSNYQFDDMRIGLGNDIASVGDIIDLDVPPNSQILDAYDTVKYQSHTLKAGIEDYETSHETIDFSNLDTLISKMRLYLSSQLTTTQVGPADYQPGSVFDTPEALDLVYAWDDSYSSRMLHEEDFEAAWGRETERVSLLEDEWVQQRMEQGIQDLIVGGLIVVGGIACICLTAGMATPWVVAGTLAGCASIVYGGSNMYEAFQDIQFASQGDYSSVAFNPVRDTVFAAVFGEGDKQLAWDTFGAVAVGSTAAVTLFAGAACAAAAAVSAGTSVPRAVGVYAAKTGFSLAVGTGSGTVGKQVALDLGFSETSAKTIGIVVGVTAGAAAGYGAQTLDEELNASGYYQTQNPEQALQRGIIQDVENGDIELVTNAQKGNYGEMKMDQSFEDKGYERISVTRTTDLDAAPSKGIDGVYFRDGEQPEYVIAESKYRSSGGVSMGNTNDGVQMSEDWIRGSNRLINAVGRETASRIFDTEYSKVLVIVKPGGIVETKILP
ncbi:MAG: T7SS effector LXG polymorphic toxin [Coriobacteriia bacterium]|nr:T7SS effector LXG polymorphic toxin [Coriobacteriia bacterium]